MVALAGVLSGTSVLLLSLQPAPLKPMMCNVLSAVDDVQSLELIFKTQVRVRAGRWKYIYIHQSKTGGGDAVSLSQGSEGLGDHFVIGNGDGCGDGEIQVGQRWNQQAGALPPEGASAIDPACISICVIGDLDSAKPTAVQMRRLTQLVNVLQERCRIAPGSVMLVGQSTSAGVGRHFPVADLRDRLLP